MKLIKLYIFTFKAPLRALSISKKPGNLRIKVTLRRVRVTTAAVEEQ